MCASSKEFLDIQATMECGFTLKCVRDMTHRHTLMFFEVLYSLNPSLPSKRGDKIFQKFLLQEDGKFLQEMGNTRNEGVGFVMRGWEILSLLSSSKLKKITLTN